MCIRDSLAVAEIPPTTAKGFEHRLLRLAQKIRLGGTHVAFVVTPNSHRQSKAATWVQRWNRLEHVPFQFLRTCTCCLGRTVSEQHHPVFLGTSYPVPTGTCSVVQVTGCERALSLRVLEGILAHCVHTLSLSSVAALEGPSCEDVPLRSQWVPD